MLLQDGAEDFGLIAAVKRILPGEHAVEHHRCGPTIDRKTVTRAKPLRRHVMNRTGHHTHGGALSGCIAGRAEIADFDDVFKNEKVGGLDVAMNDSVLLQHQQAFEDFDQIFSSLFCPRGALTHKVGQAAGNIFHEHTGLVPAGVSEIENTDQAVGAHLHDRFNTALFHVDVFVQDFQSGRDADAVFYQVNVAVTALAQITFEHTVFEYLVAGGIITGKHGVHQSASFLPTDWLMARPCRSQRQVARMPNRV